MITLHFNNETLEVQENESTYAYLALQQKPQFLLKFSLPYWVDIPIGASCEYKGIEYFLSEEANIKKKGSRNIEYSLIMGTDEDKMGLYKMRNTVDKRLKYSMCAKPHEFLQEIVNNLNERFGADAWSVGECIDAPEKTIEFNHTYIDAALQSVSEAFETEREIVGRVIHLRKVEYFKNDPLPLSYGKGNGFIPGVGRTTPSGEKPIKRLYVQGGTQNIDRSKYGSAELLLPKGQTLEYEGRTYRSDNDGYCIERVDVVSTAVKEDSLDCSEIYPARVGSVSSVKVVDEAKNFYDFVDNSIPEELNFNDYIIEGETPFIRFQSGRLAGEKDFEFKYIHAERRFELVPQEIDGQTMPNDVFIPQEGDTYAVFGIMLPDAYICNNEDKSGASWDMFREAARHLYENEDQKFTFSGTLQGLWAKRNWLRVGGRLKVGAYILFTDDQFAKDGVPIRITGIKDYPTKPYSPTIELSNSVTGKALSSALREISNQEVLIDDTKKEIMSFTKRRFRDAKETISMLSDSLLNFEGAINPIAVQTMAMLVGDESLQFRFVESVANLVPVIYNITYNQETKQLHCPQGFLQHMTLGVKSISSAHKASEYKVWEVAEYLSPALDQPEKKYYLYAKVSFDTSVKGEFVLSESAIDMEAEAGYYHLLVGVLNSEYEGERSYVSLYGFTEILPGRVSTDMIVSADGQTYFDLANSIICGNIRFRGDGGTIVDMNAYYNYLANTLSGIQNQIDGAIESFFYKYNPRTDNEPAASWTTTSDKEKHLNDTFTNLKTGHSWRWTKDGDTYDWVEITDTATVEALRKAGEAQDTADGKRRVFVDTPYPPYDIGDLWVEGVNGDIWRCAVAKQSGLFAAGDFIKASKYTDDSSLNTFIDSTFANTVTNLTTQIDGKIETWFQTTDPATSWTTVAEKAKHKGDMWYNSTAKKLKRYTGSAWEDVNDQTAIDAYDKAEKAQDTADGKRRVFVAQPVPPYDIGDLWVQGTDGDIMRCQTAKAAGASYAASDWVKASKYTDDSALETFKTKEFKELHDNAVLKETIISGGYIKTELIDAESLKIHKIYSPDEKKVLTFEGDTLICENGLRIKGMVQNSTAYTGNYSDASLFYLPAITSAKYITMGYEAEDVGKVCRLYNSSPFGGATYWVSVFAFSIVKNSSGGTTTDSTIGSDDGMNYYVLVPPQTTVELTCFELPKTFKGTTYDLVARWDVTSRFGCDNFVQDDAKGRFPRALAIGTMNYSSSSVSVSGYFYDGRTLSSVFTVTREAEGKYKFVMKSGSLPSGYFLMATGLGEGYMKPTVVKYSTTTFYIFISDDSSANDGSCDFMLLDPYWWYNMQ